LQPDSFCSSRLFDPCCEVKNSATGEFVLERDTPPGVYQYKFIVDGEWILGILQQPGCPMLLLLTLRLLRMANEDLPTVSDNGASDGLDGCCELIESECW